MAQILEHKVNQSGINNAFFDKNTDFTSPTAIAASQAGITFDMGELYDYGGKELGYISRYPTYSPIRDNEDFFAQQQGFGDKLGNTLGQFWALGSNAYMNHFAQYGREFDAVTSGDFNKLWNTTFGEDSAQMIRAISNKYPIYETEEQQARRDMKGGALASFAQFVPFTGRAGNAWANLAGQLGFTAGTIGGVVTETAGLALATAATGGSTGAITAGKTALNLKKISSIKSMWNFIRETRGLTQIGRAVNLPKNIVSTIGDSKALLGLRGFTAAAGEASIEANSASEEFKLENAEEYRNKYGEDNYLQKLEEDATKVGNYTFGFNMPVLLASNALTIGNLFKPGNFTKAAILNTGLRGKLAEESVYLSKKTAIKEIFKNYPKIQKGLQYSGRAAGFVRTSLSEGTEEFLQGVGSRAAKHAFSQIDSDTHKGFGAFMTAASAEFGKSTGTREGWDEFAAGFLTGFGIKGFGSIYNRVTGKAAKEAQVVKRGVENITEANSRYINAVTQLATLEKTQQSINENDIKTAKDVTRDSEIQLFNTLSEYGVVEDYLDELGNQIKGMSEAEQKDLLQDRTVDDVVNSVKDRFLQYDELYKRASKQIGNPYQQGTPEHRTWDAAIRVAASFEVYSKDAFDRVKTLQDEMSEKYPIDETIISAAFDPTTLPSEIRDLEGYIKKREETLDIEGLSKEERSKRKEEIKKEKDKLTVLQRLEKVYYEEGKLKEPDKKERQTSETVSAILKGMYGNEAVAPAELKQSLTDALELENDAYEYRNLYNLLSNRELFDKFGAAYVTEYLKGTNRVQKNVQNALDNNVTEPTDVRYTEKDFNDAIEDIDVSGEALNQIGQIKGKINNGEITRNVDGTLQYKGKNYTKQELFEEILTEQGATKDINTSSNNAEETVRQSINKYFNELIEGIQAEPAEILQQNTPTPDEQKGEKIDSREPKTKAEAEKERFAFYPKGNKTLLHYFDKVIAKIWSGIKPLDTITKNLKGIGDTETVDKIVKAVQELGENLKAKDVKITTLYLSTDDLVYGDKKKEDINKSETIRVINDGIRHYIITKEGTGKTASQIIEEELGLQIEDVNQNVVVRRNGIELTSPFRASENLNEENDAAIHNVKRGDKLILEVTDNEYNNQLLQENNQQKITDRLHISVKHNGVVVGVLRAADFLFELKNNTLVKDFRNQLQAKLVAGELVQGLTLGEVTMIAPIASRNRNFKGGKIQWTSLLDFNPAGFTKKTFFFINEKGEMIDENEKVVTDTDTLHDRRNFRKGAVYMKIEKPDGTNHTSQIYRSDKQPNEPATFTEKEFKDEKYFAVGQTDLNPNNPILSKRLIIDLRVNENITNVENANEEKAQQFDDINEAEVIITDVHGNEKVVTGAERKDNTITSNQGEFNLNDVETITSADEAIEAEVLTDDTTLQRHSVSWEKVRGGTQQEIEQWLLTEGQTGVQYELPDGTVITVEHKENDAVVYSVNRNGNIYYTGLNKKGDRKVVISINGKMQLQGQSLEGFDELLMLPESQPIPMKGVYAMGAGTVQENQPRFQSRIIQKIKNTLSTFGIDADAIFNKMQKAYKESVLAGTPIKSLTELTEKAGLTTDELSMFDYVVTPIFYSDVFSYITQAESFWDNVADNAWQKFRSDITTPLDELETAINEVSTEKEYDEKINRIVDAIQAVFKKTGIVIPDLTDLSLIAVENIQLLINTIREGVTFPDIREGFTNLQRNLAKLELRIETTLLTVNKVAKNSLGRNPINSYDLGNSIYKDLEMSNVQDDSIYVRNDKGDGYFVKVKVTKKKVPQNVVAFQKNVENLISLTLPLGYLNAYLTINNDFSKLKERVLQEKTRQQPSKFGKTIINNNQIKTKNNHYKIITSAVKADVVELENGDTYFNLLPLENNDTLYLKADQILTAQQFRNISKEYVVVRNVPKKLSSIGQRIERVKGLNKTIEEINCK